MQAENKNAGRRATGVASIPLDANLLTATQALSAIQALVTSAVSHSDVAAARTSRRVLLKVRDGIAQRFNFALGRGRFRVFVAAAVAVAVRRPQIDDLCIFGQREFRDWPV